MTIKKTDKAIIAVNRFGLGATGDELSDARHDPEQWLLQQLVSPGFDKTLGNAESAFDVIADIYAYRKKRKQAKLKGPDVGIVIVEPYQERLLKDSLNLSVTTDTPFAMRMLDFFSNHFSVSASTLPMKILSPTLEREAISPNVFGKFEDMLIAVVKHPAMLIYLNNENSVGPNSPMGRSVRGLNENLAREIFELHTLGINGGYALEDISQLAMAISGWSVTRTNEMGSSRFKFLRRGHEPGVRKILGKSYASGEVAQGEAVLRDLARHKNTAQFVSYKLAQHLIADQPPEALVAAMRDTWLETDGNIKAVLTTVIKHPQSWQSEALKFKTPREFVVSALRAVIDPKMFDQHLLNIALRGLTLMGQFPFKSGSPAGYGQLGRDWNGSNALIKRINWVNLLSKRIVQTPQVIAARTFDSQLSASTVKSIAGAESRAQGLSLLLLSPEFQRR